MSVSENFAWWTISDGNTGYGYKIIKVLAFKFYDDMVYKLPNFSFQKSDFEVFP